MVNETLLAAEQQYLIIAHKIQIVYAISTASMTNKVSTTTTVAVLLQ